MNQINSYVPYRPSGSLQNLQYSYDLLGNVTARSDTTSGANRAETFSYDRLPERFLPTPCRQSPPRCIAGGLGGTAARG